MRGMSAVPYAWEKRGTWRKAAVSRLLGRTLCGADLARSGHITSASGTKIPVTETEDRETVTAKALGWPADRELGLESGQRDGDR